MTITITSVNPLLAPDRCPDDEPDRWAWFRRSAPREDVKFLGRVSARVHAEALEMLTTTITRHDAAQLAALWRLRARRDGLKPSARRAVKSHLARAVQQQETAMTNAKHTKSKTARAKKPAKSGVDWVAAGKKAYETRMRNLVAKRGAKAAKPERARTAPIAPVQS